jgi:tetratricopeptide (TPR) repeat protein
MPQVTSRIVAISVILALVSPARAQDPAGQPSDDETAAKASPHIKQGRAYLDAKVYDQAIKELETAYSIDPRPPLLFSIAEAYEGNGNMQRALDTYQKYLAKAGVDETELTDRARVRVAELTKKIREGGPDVDRQKWQDERDRRRHGRKVGNIFIYGVGGAGILTMGLGIYAGDGGGGPVIFGVGVAIAVVGLGFGIPKRLLNRDIGEFRLNATASGGVKALVLSGRF